MTTILEQPQSFAPSSINQKHWQEWLDSGVDPAIITANVKTLDGDTPFDYLCYSDQLERINSGRLTTNWMRRYAHTEGGGWWCSGLDPLNNWEPMLWGCFKPDSPYINPDGKLIKYEHPARTKTRVFCLKAPGVDLHQVQADPETPIFLAEGAKKTGALLTLGYAAIGLPGVTGGVKTPKDEDGTPTGEPCLIPELEAFATKNREVLIVFDHDTKAKVIRNVNREISKLGRALTDHGCKVKVINLPGPEKGVDDFIVSRGREAFDALVQLATPWEKWQVSQYSQLTYSGQHVINSRYLGELPIPADARLICLKAPKGTGKTESMVPLADEAIRNGQPVILITHRVQLGQQLADRLGVSYLTELKESEEGALLGFGLCIDSLHPQSQARFKPKQWSDALVIIDECEQVLWHGLNSQTCQKDRVRILKTFRTLLTNTLRPGGSGRVILSDADLTDQSINLVRGLAGVGEQPWICLNTWKPEQGWNVHHYQQSQPVAWYAALEQDVSDGGRPFIVTSAQKAKSTWGTFTLESRLVQQFPDKRILRIDSETIADPSHPAYGCISKLNQVLTGYDIVIASPSIETGVSIDIKRHFTSVWGCFQGVTPDHSVRQALARLREPVDRHIWVRKVGVERIGNGATSIRSLLASQHKLIKANIQSLQHPAFAQLDTTIAPILLRTWAGMAVRINAGMKDYRKSVVDGLKGEGHTLTDAGEDADEGALKTLKAEMITLKDTNHQSECEAIAAAPEITASEYQQLEQQRAKTPDERRKERKHKLKLRYGVDVTAELVVKDDAGWHPCIRMLYYMTLGSPYLQERDRKILDSQQTEGEGSVWAPDLNKSLLNKRVEILKALGIPALLEPGREAKNSDEDIQQLAELVKANRWQLRAALGITINKDASPITICQQLLRKLGLKLVLSHKEGGRGQQQRVYVLDDPQDGREEVFQAWLERDSVVTDGNK